MPKRIAIVEDEAELASLIDYNLARHGYQTQILRGDKGTLEELERAKPDLIVLDVMLPDVDGFQLCRQIRQSQDLARTPVCFSPRAATRWTACSAWKSAATIT